MNMVINTKRVKKYWVESLISDVLITVILSEIVIERLFNILSLLKICSNRCWSRLCFYQFKLTQY